MAQIAIGINDPRPPSPPIYYRPDEPGPVRSPLAGMMQMMIKLEMMILSRFMGQPLGNLGGFGVKLPQPSPVEYYTTNSGGYV